MRDTWGREVTVDTSIWRNETGNGWTGKEPRGRNDWAFHFGGYTYGETPSTECVIRDEIFSVAKKVAMQQCAAQGLSMVVVLAPPSPSPGF